MENEKKLKKKGILEIRKSLIKQVQLLSKASSEGGMDDGISNYSEEMVKIHKELGRPFRSIFIGLVILYFCIYFHVLVKKFCR